MWCDVYICGAMCIYVVRYRYVLMIEKWNLMCIYVVQCVHMWCDVYMCGAMCKYEVRCVYVWCDVYICGAMFIHVCAELRKMYVRGVICTTYIHMWCDVYICGAMCIYVVRRVHMWCDVHVCLHGVARDVCVWRDLHHIHTYVVRRVYMWCDVYICGAMCIHVCAELREMYVRGVICTTCTFICDVSCRAAKTHRTL